MRETDNNVLPVWLYGKPIGGLGRTYPEHHRDLTFSYQVSEARPFSVAFPNPDSYEEPARYSGLPVYQWFNNLLPEGASRQRFARIAKAGYEDVLQILNGNARAEYLGAIQFCEPGAAQQYRLIEPSKKNMSLFAHPQHDAAGISPSIRTISLSGATTKIGVTIDRSGNWHHPAGAGSLSTHILKINQAALQNCGFETIEVCSQAALSVLGIDGAHTELTILDNTQALLSKRFDRFITDTETLQVKALHQEELMAAASGDPDDRHMHDDAPEHWSDRVGYPKLATLLREHASRPEHELTRLARLVAATYLIGDSDKHPKNIALLHSDPAAPFSVTLAPAYDTASAYCLKDMGYSQHQALPIGREYLRQRIGTRSIRHFAKSIGLAVEIVESQFQDVAKKLPDAFSDAAVKTLETQPVLHQREAANNIDKTLDEINRQCRKLTRSYARNVSQLKP